jgi:hypothetical protein
MKVSRILTWVATGALVLLVGTSTMRANTIVDAPPGAPGCAYPYACGPIVTSELYTQQSWTQTQSYTDVAISVFLGPRVENQPFHLGFTAWLTTDTGPSATPPPLATISFTDSTLYTTPQNILLFSGLSLTPGTYYLTLSGTDPDFQSAAIWAESSGPQTLDTGVSFPKQTVCGGECLNSIYPPSSPFSPIGTILEFQQNLQITTTPEPATLLLFSLGGFCFLRLPPFCAALIPTCEPRARMHQP